jgi:glycosyltransferase involved in cell wall biosynthesis
MDARLDAIRHAPTILAAMHLSQDFAARVSSVPATRSRIAALDVAIDDATDELTAIAAVHGLARLLDDDAGTRLVARLRDERPFIREHAVWALAARPAWDGDDAAVRATVAAVTEGGLTGMLAQLTLERLARRWPGPGGWLGALESELAIAESAEVRVRLVESIGLLHDHRATRALQDVALGTDDEAVRVAAIGALGERPVSGAWAAVRTLAGEAGAIGETARLAMHDLAAPIMTSAGGGRRTGLRIGQLYLHAELDPELSTAGMGETGGIATLLVRLGDALAERPRIESVTTISRGPAERAIGSLGTPAGHAFAAVPVGSSVPAGISHAWPGLVDARRGIRRILRAHGPLDRLHLRMADVGSLAGAMAARAEGVPTIFSLAPDPHALIAASERGGTLTRADFGRVDARDHLWFRVSLVRRLVRQARNVALFPRPELREQLRELVGLDIAADPARYTVVPEGIEISGIEAASAEAARAAGLRAGRAGRAADVRAASRPDVHAVLAQLPADRHGLRAVLTVGRMHDLKGMARVVRAWAEDATLARTTNLIVVGGDLDRPSPDEAAELQRIREVIAEHPDAAPGLVLAGHQSSATVARLLVAVRSGHAPVIGAGGVYVSGSRKEEFGLAIVEALYAGLPVVVPRIGGPATYVEDGRTGFLVDTGIPVEIAAGLHRALAVADDDGRARDARDLVRARFTIGAMAEAIESVYARPADHGADAAGAGREPAVQAETFAVASR